MPRSASEPGLVPVGSVTSRRGAGRRCCTALDPDVVLLTIIFPTRRPVAVRGVKARDPGRRAILYSAFADGAMTCPPLRRGGRARDKGARPQELFEAIRQRRRAAPTPCRPLARPARGTAGGALDTHDLPILAYADRPQRAIRTSPPRSASTRPGSRSGSAGCSGACRCRCRARRLLHLAEELVDHRVLLGAGAARRAQQALDDLVGPVWACRQQVAQIAIRR